MERRLHAEPARQSPEVGATIVGYLFVAAGLMLAGTGLLIDMHGSGPLLICAVGGLAIQGVIVIIRERRRS